MALFAAHNPIFSMICCLVFILCHKHFRLVQNHLTQGVSEVAPQLLRALDVQKIAAVQFLRNGRVRVTTKTSDYRDELLEGSTFLFGPFRYQLPQLTSHYVLCLCVTCQLKCPMLMSSLCLNPLVSSIPSILVFCSRVPVRCQWYPSSCNVLPWFNFVVCVRV